MHCYRNPISEFVQNRSGATVIIFGLMLIPIVLVVGGAIDYSNARSQHAHLQNTLDSATLAGARALTNGEDVEAAVKEYLIGSWPAAVTLPNYSVDVEDQNVTVTFSNPPKVETRMLSMFGWGEMPVIAKSVATAGSMTVVDISLAVDRSDSMKGNKGSLQYLEITNLLTRAEAYNMQLEPPYKVWISLNMFKSSLDYGKWTNLWLTTNFYGAGGLKTYISDNKKWHHDGNTASGPGLERALVNLRTPDRCQAWPQTCSAPKYERYLFFLSDGDEDSKFSPRASEVCAKARSQNVNVVVIGFPGKHGGDTSNLMACAGSSSNFRWADGQQMMKVLEEAMKDTSFPRLIK